MSPPIREDITREVTVAITVQGQGALRNLVAHLRGLADCFVDDPKLSHCLRQTESAAKLLELLADGPSCTMVIAGIGAALAERVDAVRTTRRPS